MFCECFTISRRKGSMMYPGSGEADVFDFSAHFEARVWGILSLTQLTRQNSHCL